MANKDIKMLVEAIGDYLQWVKSMEGHGRSAHTIRYTQELNDFHLFTINKDIAWKDMFTIDTLEEFRKYSGFKNASRALIVLSGYLFSHGRIDKPLQIPKPQNQLPDIYEHYLVYHEQSLQVSRDHLRQARGMLTSFHRYLERHTIKLSNLKIEHLDEFMAGFKVAHSSLKTYRSHLRGFLNYLYHEQGILQKDLAPLLVGPPLFAQSKPPKFLRPQEVKKLFATLTLSTPADIRTYVMVQLAYTLGLRPVEISRITLDDISFRKGELGVRERKGKNPLTLPIPEDTLKAIAAYVLKVRATSPCRHLFLTFHLPSRPVSSATVIHFISKAMKAAGLHSSSYWLRHTYAQSLLHIGRSIYEIKEMLGHDNIQSSQRYITIHTELMRKVLFDETL